MAKKTSSSKASKKSTKKVVEPEPVVETAVVENTPAPEVVDEDNYDQEFATVLEQPIKCSEYHQVSNDYCSRP